MTAALALATGCAKGGPAPSFPDLAGVEAEALDISDGMATAITIASAIHDEARVEAGKAAIGACKPGPDEAACKEAAKRVGREHQAARGAALRNARDAQVALKAALRARAECGEDLRCFVERGADVARRLRELTAQVDDVKGMLPTREGP